MRSPLIDLTNKPNYEIVIVSEVSRMHSIINHQDVFHIRNVVGLNKY
jgi:hypothetical protein